MAKAASYTEQFQGMYVMMRGIAAAAAIGFVYNLAWLSYGVVFGRLAVLIALAFFAIASAFAWPRIKAAEWRLAFRSFFLIAVWCAGTLASFGAHRPRVEIASAAALLLVVAYLAHGSYHEFTWRWARSVYQYFYLSTRPQGEA